MNPMILLTIIADDSLKHALEEDVILLGATGYTTSSVEGKGKTGVRNDIWSGENIKMETIVDEVVLNSIVKTLREKYFNKYPIITYWHEVSVVRTDHFVP